MKFIIATFFLFLSFLNFAQKFDVINESLTENVKIVYRGYANHIVLKAPEKEGSRFDLTVTNAAISKSGTYYILKPGRGHMVNVNVTEMVGDQMSIVHKDSFEVFNVPDPSIYINGEFASSMLPDEMKYIRVQLKPEFPLDWKFKVEGWQMLIDGELYFGQNDRIPQMVNDAIEILPQGSSVSIKVKARGEDDIMREYGVNLTKQ